MCGILGLLLHDPSIDAAAEICEGLSLLQHRGQDACGIITCGPKGRFYQCKANGMVRDVFDSSALSRLIGGMGVGHGRHAQMHHYAHTIVLITIFRFVSFIKCVTPQRGAQIMRKLNRSM